MIECFLAWGCLFVSAVIHNTDFLIASACFAIASQVYWLRKGG